MKRLLASAAFVAALATTSAAFAEPQTTNGKVKTFDAATHELSMSGKKSTDVVYYVPPEIDDANLKPGVKVTVTWELQDGKHMVSAVALKPAKAKATK